MNETDIRQSFNLLTKEHVFAHVNGGNNATIIKGVCSRIPNTYGLVINYVYLKYILSDETYDNILALITGHIDAVLKESTYVDIHLNIRYLSMKEIDKHRHRFVQMAEFFKTKYENKLGKCFVYNANGLFSTIYKIFEFVIDKVTRPKICLVE